MSQKQYLVSIKEIKDETEVELLTVPFADTDLVEFFIYVQMYQIVPIKYLIPLIDRYGLVKRTK